MNKKVLILLAVVWTAALGLVGFSELRPEASGGEASMGSTTTETTGRGGGENADEQRAAGGGGKSGSGEAEREGVTLKVGGEAGLEFVGRCVVDGEERELGGRTPESYTYRPEERLECGLSSREEGSLRVSFSDGEGTNAVQQVGPWPSTLELTYTQAGLSTSTSSKTSTNQTSSSQTSSSQTSSSQTSGSQVSSSQSIRSSSQSGISQQSSQVSSQSSSSVVRPGSE